MPKQDLILIALDESPILKLMEKAVRAAGYNAAIAKDQASVNKIIQEATPGLILIGEKLYRKDGIKIASELLERFPTMPIILFAEKDTPALTKAVIANGLSGYLYPPLKMADILNEIQRCLDRAAKLGDWLRREVKRTTSSLNAKAKLSESERAKLEAVIANIQDGVIVMDSSQQILMINRAICDIFGLKQKDIVGKLVTEISSNPDLQVLFQRSAEGPYKYHEVNFEDGRVFSAQLAAIPKVGAAITMQDISYLKEMDKLKSDFIHTVSHDLRSPLTSVMGYTELIERTGPLNENQREFLSRLQSSVKHIKALINDLLDLGRLEAGFDSRRENVRLDAVLQYSLDMFEGQAKKKKLKVSVNTEGEIKALRANPIRIRQMVDNLIGNAIKYTPEAGAVTVNIMMQDNQIIFKVDDTGPGIPAEEHVRVFEKFFRATNAPEGVEGSGIGLAIVKGIVESHQGRIWVESTVGKGSSFIVILPAQE